MKKMYKKVSAMTAAVMSVSTMGAMNVFAASIEARETSSSTKTATVEYYAELYDNVTTSGVPRYVGNNNPNNVTPTDDDNGKYVWSIEVSEISLTHTFTATLNRTADYTVRWDPQQGMYVRENANTSADLLVGLTEGVFGDYSITNNSNFDVTWTGVIGDVTTLYTNLLDNGVTYSPNIPTGGNSIAIGGNVSIGMNVDITDGANIQAAYNALKTAYLSNTPGAFKLFDYNMTFTPGTPVPFEQGGSYDAGATP